MIKCDIKTATNGTGLWSEESKELSIRKIELVAFERFEGRSFGEVQAFFRKKEWNIDKIGLIYTDRLWLKMFREGLVQLGFAKSAVKDVDYSEQGMQGDNYVSLDCGNKFINQFEKLFGKKKITWIL